MDEFQIIKRYFSNIAKKNNKIDSSFSVHKLYKHFWTTKNQKQKKVCDWMNKYTSRQIAPKLYREDTGLACATKSYFWRKGRRIGNKVKFIINDEQVAFNVIIYMMR